jgi:hypothetical protein
VPGAINARVARNGSLLVLLPAQVARPLPPARKDWAAPVLVSPVLAYRGTSRSIAT